MNKKTLTALRGSIAKWERILAGDEGDSGSDNCPLCHLFLSYSECRGCPVAARTGKSLCMDTPYDAWLALDTTIDSPTFAETDEQKVAAQAELDFLKSLLPENA